MRSASFTHSRLRRLAAPVLALACALMALPATPAGANVPRPAREVASWPADAVPGRLIVTLADGWGAVPFARAAGDAAVRSLGGDLRLVAVAPGREAAAAEALRALPGVRAVEPDLVRAWAAIPDDPLFSRQWSHEQVGAEGAWRRSTGRRRVRVAVVDSGIHGGHPDLAENMVEQVDLSNGTPLRRPLRSDNDTCGIGHGTQVAGVLGARGDNGVGLAGAAWEVGIVDLAVGSTATPGSCDGAADSAILSALHYAAFHPDGPVDVVNLSVGGRQAWCPEAYAEAIAEARSRSVVVVAAAGNSGPGTAQVPASCPGVIAVGATGPDGLRAPYSAANRWIDLAAPGGSDLGGDGGFILTTDRKRGYAERQGTSFAAPYVSGVVALLRSMRADLSPDEVESILEHSTEFDGEGGRSDDLGWGRLRADNALSYASRRQVVPPPEPDPWFPVLRLIPPADGPGVTRVAYPDYHVTQPIRQAVATSRAVFASGGAVHAVVARADDFPDALAGSALGMGVGPLLFNPPGGELDPQSRKELRRALPSGATVYVLGGADGVSPMVEAQLVAMGYEVSRLAGATREETAARVAREIQRIRRRAGLGPVPEVLLATRADWPDAVGAGALAARFGMPVLLTAADHLHPATADVLADLRPRRITVIGSAGRVSDRVALDAQDAAQGAELDRLGGASRDETAVAVSRETLRRLGSARLVIAVNLRRADAASHALSASVLAGAHGGVFLPLEGEGGHALTAAARDLLAETLQKRARPADLLAVLAGGDDLVGEAVAAELDRALRSGP